MAGPQANPILRYLRHWAARQSAGVAPDHEHLARFVGRRDEAAFAELVRRHGPAVLRVCRAVLGEAHAAEDAFQATFLVLARKAGSVRQPGALGNWLYRVAYLRTDSASFSLEGVSSSTAAPPYMSVGTASSGVVGCGLVSPQLIRPTLQDVPVQVRCQLPTPGIDHQPQVQAPMPLPHPQRLAQLAGPQGHSPREGTLPGPGESLSLPTQGAL